MLTVAFLFAAVPVAVPAHPSVSESLRAVSEELRTRPDSAELLLERAELYRRAGDAERAAVDYEEVLRRRPDLVVARLGRARLRLATGELDRALADADRYVAAAPDDPAGWWTRSRILAGLDRPAESARDLRRAVDAQPSPSPSLFLELARRLADLGPGDLPAALATLDEGQSRLGTLASLQWPAIEWELARGRPDAALARLDTLLPWYERRETWLAARGDILLRAGRFLEAQAAYTEAWEALAALPPTRSDDPAVRRLRDRLERAMHAPGGLR